MSSPGRRSLLLAAAGLPLVAAAPDRPLEQRIVATDWAATESLLALGVTPLATVDVASYREWLPSLPLPDSVLDLGSRAEPNMELLAGLRPERILISNWQRALLGQFGAIAPVEVVTILGSGPSPLDNARAALRRIGVLMNRDARAKQCIEALETVLAPPAITARPLYIGVLHENGRQLFAYGRGSWVQEILDQLGLRNALARPTSAFGNALLDIAHLIESPEALLLYLDQGERTRRAERALRQSSLWQGLPLVRAGRARSISPFYALGGVPSALYCATLLRRALADG
jgi:iron complex transport system substrate-binding protein